MYTIEKGVLADSSAYFHTPGKLAKTMFFYLICAGHFYCDKNYHIERKNYDSYLLMYVKKGEGTVSYNGKTYIAKANDVIFLNCYEPHMYETNGWETLWFHFDGNVSDEFFQYLYHRTGCVISLGDSTVITEYLEKILNSLKAGEMLKDPLISCYIQRMLTELILLASEDTKDDTNSSNPVWKVKDYINRNYKNKITLMDLSAEVSMSPFYFSRLFKRETGCSPYEYIIMIRLNHAKTLLKTTALRVKEIAFEVGFHSEANFVTCFKDHVNITPSEFRAIPF